jgi:hypothetical protein
MQHSDVSVNPPYSLQQQTGLRVILNINPRYNCADTAEHLHLTDTFKHRTHHQRGHAPKRDLRVTRKLGPTVQANIAQS